MPRVVPTHSAHHRSTPNPLSFRGVQRITPTSCHSEALSAAKQRRTCYSVWISKFCADRRLSTSQPKLLSFRGVERSETMKNLLLFCQFCADVLTVSV